MSSPVQNNITNLQNILNTVNSLPEQSMFEIDAVLYTEQTLTEEQKAQARENIGVLEPLIGSTDDITPAQVLQAIQAGRNITLSCSSYDNSNAYGTLTFTTFHLAGSGQIVASSCTIDLQGNIINASLSGHTIDNTWTCTTPTLAKQDDIPEAINTALAQAKESGEFDGEDGITPHIGANGNWFIGDTDTGKPSRGEDGTDGNDGNDGKDGTNGNDGVSPTVAVSKSGKVTTISITDKNGTKTATINDGEDGDTGEATVTADTIKNALGYTPADVTDVFKDALQPTFTNIFDTVGIEYGKMLNTDGTAGDTAVALAVTDFIPVSAGSVIRVNDDFALYCVTNSNTPRVIVYDSAYSKLTLINNTAMVEGGYYIELLEKNADGHIISFRVNKPANAAFIRICNHTSTIGKKPVLTVDEEISYEVGYGTRLNPNVRIDQSQIDNAPVKNGWSILPYERLNICYSGINRKPINTVEHFTDAATNFGYNALKCDVRPTSDGELVCCHDAGFTFDSNGYITSYDSANQTKIHDVTAATCLGYSFKTGEHPCLVGDYLDVCRTHGKVAFITIRNEYMDVVIPKLLEELRIHNMTYSSIINCMTYESLVQWRQQDKNVMINYTLNFGVAIDQAQIDRAVGLGYCSLCGFGLTSSALEPNHTCDFEYARQNGIRLLQAIAYKEGSPEACYAMGYDGCQIGIPWNPKSSGGGITEAEVDSKISAAIGGAIGGSY